MPNDINLKHIDCSTTDIGVGKQGVPFFHVFSAS